MDEYSSRRSAGGLVISRRGSSLVLRDSAENTRDRNVQVCSRVGCSSKLNLNTVKGPQAGSPSKAKTSKTPFRSSVHGKDIVGTSSRTLGSANTSKKSSLDPKKKSPTCIEADSESSSVQNDSVEILDPSSSSGKAQLRVHPELEDHEHFEATTSTEAGSSTSGPVNKFVRKNTQKFGSSSSPAFKAVNQGARNGASTSRYNMRNLKCNSISDVVQSGCSSPTESSMGRRRDNYGRKRIGEPEGSMSARGKKINGPMIDDRRNNNLSGISISDSRRNRNVSATGDHSDGSSVRARRSNARSRLNNQENRNRLPQIESPLGTSSSPRIDTSFVPTSLDSESQFLSQIPSSRASTYSRQGSGSDRPRPNRSIPPYDVGMTRPVMNRDNLRQYNLDGIAEMLLALERIEQEEEPSYEQLLVLENNLFLGGFPFPDQHRDMRLDIDNMSYEELLALEERMGSVSTAVPEEALAECLRKSIYQWTANCRENEDDIKCSICQEEYVNGDKVGRLVRCDHRYHVECVHQWLRLKNWCPICKASAALSPQ